MTLRGSHRQGADGATAYRAGDRRRIGNGDGDLAGNNRIHRVAAALVGDVGEGRAGALIE